MVMSDLVKVTSFHMNSKGNQDLKQPNREHRLAEMK